MELGPYQRRWNDLQNTPRDVQVIADHLLSAYRRALKRLGPPEQVPRRRQVPESASATRRAHASPVDPEPSGCEPYSGSLGVVEASRSEEKE